MSRHRGTVPVTPSTHMDLHTGWTESNLSVPEPFNSTGIPSSLPGSLPTSPHLSARTKLFMEVLMVLMCLGAVTGNILVIVIVAATKTFHSVTSVLIINLAISDLLVGLGVMPFVAVSVMNVGWVSCNDLCLYVGYTSSVYCTASVLTLAAIALDRYHSIVDCLRYSSRCTARRTAAAVVWIWLQALLSSCPPLLGWSSVGYIGPMYSCSVNWSSSPSYTCVMAALSFLVPAAVILFCYVRIVQVARGHARRIHHLEEQLQRGQRAGPVPPGLLFHISGRFVSEAPSAHSSAPRESQQHSLNPHHGTLRLLLVISAFLLCWTPYMCVALVQAAETALSSNSGASTSVVPPSAVTFSYWLVLFNSDINPLLYALLSQRFQGALRSLRRKLRGSPGVPIGRGFEGGGILNAQPRGADLSTDRTVCPSVFSLDSDTQGVSMEAVFLPGSPSPSSSPSSSTSSSSHSVWLTGKGKLENLQVPSQPQEGRRLPSTNTVADRQTTFFYGEITVRVEHDVC